MKEQTILQAIFPVAQQIGTTLLATTTPQGSDNVVSRLITTQDEYGDPIIAAVRIGKPCDQCRALKQLCMHKESATAEGLSRKKRQKFQAFYKGQEHIAMREFQGEIGDSSQHIFLPKWLNALAKRPTMSINGPVELLFMTMDPAQGGFNELGVTTCYFSPHIDSQIIVHMDAYPLHPATGKNIKSILLRILNTVRCAQDSFKDVPIVIAVESAPKIFTEQIGEFVSDLLSDGIISNVWVMCKMPGERPGVPKTNQNTQDMCTLAADFMEAGKVFFSDNFVVSRPGVRKEDMKEKLIQQLLNFKKKEKERTDSFAPPRIRIDGKEGGSTNDDLGVSFIMQRYWYTYFWNDESPLYKEAKQTAIRLCSDYVRGNKRTRQESIGNTDVEITSSAQTEIQLKKQKINNQNNINTNLVDYSKNKSFIL